MSVHPLSRLGPSSAYLGQCEIALGQFRATAVDPVEDVDDDVDCLVFSGDFFDVQVDLLDAMDAIQAIQEICHAIRMGGEEWLDLRSGTLLQQRCDVDPQRVVAHLDGLVESESLLIDVKAQIGEGPRIALEESGRLAAHKAVERGDALLAVQQQLDKARCHVLLAARGRCARWHRPDEQACRPDSDGIATA